MKDSPEMTTIMTTYQSAVRQVCQWRQPHCESQHQTDLAPEPQPSASHGCQGRKLSGSWAASVKHQLRFSQLIQN